jgi:multicomponent Na+:H+ antiporter subunit C
MALINNILNHINYIGSAAIFVIGLYTVLSHQNLIKRVIGINIMYTAVFLFFISIGYINNANPPIINLEQANLIYINPVPSALILTGIVVSVSVTAFSLSLIIRIYESYGSIDNDELAKIKEVKNK